MPSSRTPADPDPELELGFYADLGCEARAVLRWRIETLELAGYPPREAWAIAKSRADLHDAIELLKRGCSPELAARILT